MTPHLVFLLEERSAREMLNGLLEKILPADVSWRCIIFEGKQDLEKQLVRRIRGYRVPGAKFIVLRDQDAADCHAIKARLKALCRRAGRPETFVRIACREIESWYLADLEAVGNALGIKKLARLQAKSKYRHPDKLQSPAKELEILTNGRYQKISGSRLIGRLLDPDNTRSHSFQVFLKAILAAAAPPCNDGRAFGRGQDQG